MRAAVHLRSSGLDHSQLSLTVGLYFFPSLSVADGMRTFAEFLRTEFSEENIEFWLACEDYKNIDSETKLLSTAKYIYTVFIDANAPKEVRHDTFIYRTPDVAFAKIGHKAELKSPKLPFCCCKYDCGFYLSPRRC